MPSASGNIPGSPAVSLSWRRNHSSFRPATSLQSAKTRGLGLSLACDQTIESPRCLAKLCARTLFMSYLTSLLGTMRGASRKDVALKRSSLTSAATRHLRARSSLQASHSFSGSVFVNYVWNKAPFATCAHAPSPFQHAQWIKPAKHKMRNGQYYCRQDLHHRDAMTNSQTAQFTSQDHSDYPYAPPQITLVFLPSP